MARESLNAIATSVFEYQVTDKSDTAPDVVNSFLTSGSFGRKYNDGLISDLNSSIRAKYGNGATTGVYDVGGYGHSSVNYGSSPMLGAGIMPVAKLSLLSDSQKSWYSERAALLDSKLGTSIKSGFAFDIDNSKTDAAYDTGTIVPSLINAVDRKISSDIISASEEKAFVSASLTEFLLALLSDTFGSALKITGGFGLQRQNDSPKTSGAEANTITDHAFGRAFDFSLIQKVTGPKPNSINTANGHVEQLTTLLEKLNVMPAYLIPDYIAVSAKYVDKSYDTYESKTNQLWAKYPNLKYLKLKRDTSGVHDNHIHISFSPARGGIYAGAGGLLYNPASASGVSSSAQAAKNKALYLISPYGAMPTNILKKDFTGNTNSPKPEEVFLALTEIGYFSDETAAIFVALANRESLRRVYIVDTIGAVGLWQVSAGKSDGGNITVHIKLPQPESINPFSKMAYVNWQKENLTNDQIWEKIKEQGKTQDKGIGNYDTRLWNLTNQVWILRSKIGRGAGKSIVNDLPVFPWGDYGGRFAPKYGWVSSTSGSFCRFADAADVYTKMTGKTSEDLKEFLIAETPSDSRTLQKDIWIAKNNKTILENWIDGVDYPKVNLG